MGHPRISEDERRYRALEPQLRVAVQEYSIGIRTTGTLVTLAHGKVLADVLGWFTPMPPSWDRSSWEDVLSKLVKQKVGTHRCLRCQKGFTVDKALRPGPCPHCHDAAVEELSTTVGVL